MSKPWQAYALHIIDTVEKIRRIEARGDLTQDEVLYDAALRNLQNILAHNYLGNIDPLTVAEVIRQQLHPLQRPFRSCSNRLEKALTSPLPDLESSRRSLSKGPPCAREQGGPEKATLVLVCDANVLDLISGQVRMERFVFVAATAQQLFYLRGQVDAVQLRDRFVDQH